MNELKIHILFVQNSPVDMVFWKETMAAVPDTHVEFGPLEQVSMTENICCSPVPDILILDLSLHEGNAVNAFLRVYDTAPAVPIITVIKADDQALALRLVQEGAQDCLAKAGVNGESLNRAIHYALGRQRLLGELRSYSLVDELTGLYNRRGFTSLLDHQIKVADRTGQALLLIFADVDNLKRINDRFGHHRGDLALAETAHILKETFRETDILARWGGDEFLAALICDKSVNKNLLAHRFQKNLDNHNSYRDKNFVLSVSIGMTLHDPASPCTIEELLDRADKEMYERKMAKKAVAD